MNDKNREFHELIGKCWHPGDVWWDGTQYLCEKCKQPVDENATNPDYAADPRLVLMEMMKRKDGFDFLTTVGGYSIIPDRKKSKPMQPWILLDYILDTTGKLRDKAIEFMMEVIWHR